MVDNDGINSEVRSREEEYFRRRDRELIEKMRQAAAEDAARQELGARSGLRDPALLQELAALGFTPDTVGLLPLVPIVQVAWAEGGVSTEERTLIVQLARRRGIDAGSAADRQLESWLNERPSEEVFARATRLIRAILDDPSQERTDLRVEDLIRHCEAIAGASGGLLGFRKVSAEEHALLRQIEAALKER